jgi:hypothetical protein
VHLAGVAEMNSNERNLIKQMLQAGKMGAIIDFMPEYNLLKSKEIIEQMGNKWCCHPDNAVKRLDIPLPVLNEPKYKVLKRK